LVGYSEANAFNGTNCRLCGEVLSFASDQSNAAMAQLVRLKNGTSVPQDGYGLWSIRLAEASTSPELAVGDVAVVPLSTWRHCVPRYLDKT